MLYDAIYMTCPEQANPQRQKVGRCFPGADGGGVGSDAGGCRVPWGDGNVWGLDSVMVAQLCKYTKN